jgi:hypothetical protein
MAAAGQRPAPIEDSDIVQPEKTTFKQALA